MRNKYEFIACDDKFKIKKKTKNSCQPSKQQLALVIGRETEGL